MNAKYALLGKFKDGSFALCTDEEIAKLLRLGRRERFAVRDMLLALCREGELLSDSRSRFGTAAQFGAVSGEFSGNERGFGFVLPDDGSAEMFIPPRAVKDALHGDTVLAFRTGSGDEGEILAVLSRGRRTVVGVYRREKQAGYLLPDDRRLCAEVYIPAGKNNGCKNGSKAVAAILSYKGRTPVGEIQETLGAQGDLFAEELSVLRAHGLREEFPAEAEAEARRQEKRPISKRDLLGREDLREELIVTVDGEDTRDIDDAISVREEKGTFFLGVHIADVSHYVARGSLLDGEAYARGTSVYFPDRVLPMLPKALSNGICSLNEGEDRLTLSCFMTVDRRGRVTDRYVRPSVIRSRHRMTYTEMTKIAENDPQTVKKYADLTDFVKTAVRLTEILKRARKARGSVEFEIRETKILYEKGKISIPEPVRTISHEMIEEFMVLANESVAALMAEKNVPFLYRVHEPPSPEKAESFASFLAAAGIKAGFRAEKATPREYAALLGALEGSPLFPIANRVMLRSMMKARYSAVNAGHFGLASERYCHFTSPIRRYPDLCVHRIVKAALTDPAKAESFRGFVEEAAVRTSESERNAAEAERETDALYIIAYMREKIGERFEATVSGMNAAGLFAELDNAVEGFLPMETLPSDEYALPDERLILRGRKHSFAIGDKIEVRVAGIDGGMRRTLFAFVKKIGGLQ